MDSDSDAGLANTLGVTGGIGSGKSLACRYLSELGAAVFEADQVAKQLMVQPGEVRQAIMQAFGKKSYLPQGQVNTAWLSKRVFDDAAALAELNAIVHPAVRRAFEQAKTDCDEALLVHEAALIYEAGINDQLDAVAVIAAPEDLRIRRIQERDQVSAENIRKRMAHQWSQDELERRADIVIINVARPGALRSKMSRLFGLASTAKPLNRSTFRHCRRI